MRISRCDKRKNLFLCISGPEITRYLLIGVNKLAVRGFFCLVDERLDNRSLTSCTAEVAVVVTMTDSAVDKRLLAVQRCRAIRKISLRRSSSDIICLIVLNIDRYSADCINYLRE